MEKAKRSEIKDKLKALCKSQDAVFIARKFCIEQKKGKYFCVKDGKCFGDECKGCIKHECQVKGQKEIFTPPENYVKDRLKAKDFDKSVAVNVDDMKGQKAQRKWCTEIEPGKGHCQAACRELGDGLCGGPEKALKYDHVDVCKRKSEKCQCCCNPVCKSESGATTSKATSNKPSTTEKSSSVEASDASSSYEESGSEYGETGESMEKR